MAIWTTYTGSFCPKFGIYHIDDWIFLLHTNAMEKPVLLDMPLYFEGEAQYKEKCPPTVTHRLAYADCSYWKHPAFSIIEQWYDARDAFICLLEINTRITLDLPVNCQRHDLYWLYALRGSLTLDQPEDASAMELTIPHAHYCIAYIPPDDFNLRIPQGKHLFFYFVIKSDWLLRRPSAAGLEEIQSHLAKLRARLMESASTGILHIYDYHRQHIISTAAPSKPLHVEQDCFVYHKVVELLSRSLSDLTKMDEQMGSRPMQLLSAVHELIRQKLGTGEHIVISHLAEAFDVSPTYLNRIHRAHYASSLKRYIDQQKFEFARFLLAEQQLSVNDAAHLSGYTQASSFTKQFTLFFGFSPSELSRKDDD
ncbi:helix-turn-helix transcriptional regulator [Olivibacter sp. SDN3]|uniref:helix-turn-helix domain-containing protein n=1 Tax=Olivibacter sp. SDN3 TaxID=2764720 RepID=UPI00165124D4|nr:response regulator transcription factor [Olivibacter sp. SDN3]QNL47904.1 helix-turn-helix transcriptional regulator [Olivibacter sp. SDN3]